MNKVKKLSQGRNPSGVRSDYPSEVPVWNLSPITFQAGSFDLLARPHADGVPWRSPVGKVTEG